MGRNEILDKLKKLSFVSIPTVVTEDMGLQYDYISKEDICAT